MTAAQQPESSAPEPRLRMLSPPRATDIVHHRDARAGTTLASLHRDFWLESADGARLWSARFPATAQDRLSAGRLARRFLRSDQCAIMPLASSYMACRAGHVYSFDPGRGGLRLQARLRQCRNPLSVTATDDGGAVFGEYGSNPTSRPVPVWACGPDGKDWRVVYEVPAGRARHIHGVFRDPYDDAYFVATGDFAHQNWLVRLDHRFGRAEYWGDGTQKWRAVTLFFFPDYIAWITDSHLETNYVTVCERKTRRLHRLAAAPSPAWYGKTLLDGTCLVGCAWEKGAGCDSDGATLLASADAITWQRVGFWRKDPWPAPWFKNGVLRFAGGPESREDFTLFGEGLVGLDGVRLRCSLEAPT